MKIRNLLHTFLIAILIVTLYFTESNGQSIKGNWYGMLDLPEISLRLNMHIDSTKDGYIATWDSPDQGAFGIPTTRFSYDYPNIVVEHKNANVLINGSVDAKFKTITAIFKQGDTKANMSFGRDSIAPPENSMVSIKSRYKKKEVYITMRDGVKLSHRYILLSILPKHIQC